MANILTAAEASVVLRCEVTDPNMLALLPAIDAYVKRATGHDWAKENPIPDEARNAARMLLVLWHENPAMTGAEPQSLGFGLAACLTQLMAMALRYIEFHGRDGAGGVTMVGANAGDTITTLVGLIGATGDQRASFESVISISGQIQQVSDTDLSKTLFRVHLTPPGEL